jgi:O-antigen/teichoic acid export membrane protein
VVRALNLVLGIFVTALIARLLGEAVYGQWTTIFVLLGFAAYLTDLGMQGIAVQRGSADPARAPEWIGALVSVRAVVAIPAMLVSAAVVVAVASSHPMLVAGLLLSATILAAVPTSLQMVFQLQVRNHITVALLTLNSVLWAGAVVIVDRTHGSIVALAAAFLAITIVTNLVTTIVALRTGPVRLRGARALMGPLVRLGAPLALSGLLVNAYARVDQIIVFQTAGAGDAGLYGAVYRVLDQAQFIPMSVNATMFPMVAAAFATDPGRARRLLQLGADYMTVGSVGLLAFTLVCAESTVRLLFGAAFADAAPALPILMGAFIAICFGYLGGQGVIVLGLQRLAVVSAAVGLAVNIALNLLLVPRYGFLAAAWVTLVTEVVVNGIVLVRVRRGMGMQLRWGRIARTVAAGVVLAAVLVGLGALDAPFAAQILAAAVVYPGLLFALRALRPQDISVLLRRRAL